ncbi:MAG: hypothetical protein ACRDOO_22245, partial [Actinomadura sp.]
MARRGAMIAACCAAFCLALLTFMVPSSAANSAPAPAGRVVVIGVPSLLWNDISETTTPALWRLTGQGSAAALSVRTTVAMTCPIDGWLTVSAGQRARLAHGSCALPPAPTVRGGGAQAAGWPEISRDNATTSYRADVGVLGDAVHRSPGRPCTMAVGSGAVYGAADGSGGVDVYAPSVGAVPAGGWSRCALTVVDVDDVFRAYITAGV